MSSRRYLVKVQCLKFVEIEIRDSALADRTEPELLEAFAQFKGQESASWDDVVIDVAKRLDNGFIGTFHEVLGLLEAPETQFPRHADVAGRFVETQTEYTVFQRPREQEEIWP